MEYFPNAMGKFPVAMEYFTPAMVSEYPAVDSESPCAGVGASVARSGGLQVRSEGAAERAGFPAARAGWRKPLAGGEGVRSGVGVGWVDCTGERIDRIDLMAGGGWLMNVAGSRVAGVECLGFTFPLLFDRGGVGLRTMPEDTAKQPVARSSGESTPATRKRWGWPRRIITTLGFVGLLGFAVVITLLCTSGLPVDFALPYAAGKVSPVDGAWRVEMDHGLLKLNRTEGLAFILRGARIVRSDGTLAFNLASFSIYSSPASLMKGNYVPRRIVVDAPEVELVRRADGSFEFVPLPVSSSAEAEEATAFPPELPDAFLPIEGRPFELVIQQPAVKIRDGVRPLTVSFKDISTTVSRDKQTLLSKLNLVWTGPIHTATIKAEVTYSLDKKTASVGFEFSPVGMDDLLPYVTLPSLPVEAQGTVSGKARAAIDLASKRVDTFSFEVVTSALEVKASQWLRDPISLAPMRLAGSADFAKGSGSIEPLTVKAGPVSIELSEQRITQTERLRLEGGMKLGGITLGQALALLSPELRKRIPLTPEQEAGLAVDNLNLNWKLATTPMGNALPVIDTAEVEATVALQAGTQTIRSTFSVGATEKLQLIEWKTAVDSFNLAGCAVPALKEFPLEALDLPIDFKASGKMRLPDTVDALDVAFHAGPGIIKNHPLWYAYMAKPVPLKELSFQLSAKDNLKTIVVPSAVLDIDGPRGELQAITLALSSPPHLSKEFDLGVKGRILATEWLAETLWSYVPNDIRVRMDISDAEVRELGLKQATIDLDARGHLGGAAAFTLARATTTATATLKLNTLSYPVTASADFNPQSGHWSAIVDTAALLPNSLQLSIFKRFTLPAYWITTPVSTHLETSGTTTGTVQKAYLKVVVEAGEVSIPELLKKPIPVRSVVLEARADLEKKVVESFSAKADIEGRLASLNINQLLVKDNQFSGLAEVDLKQWDLAWLLSFWPDALLPKERALLEEYKPYAMLDEASLKVVVENMLTEFDPKRIKELSLYAQLTKLGVTYNNLPVTLDSLSLNLGNNRAKLALLNAQVDAFAADEVTLTTGDIMEPGCRVDLHSVFHGNLSRLSALLGKLPLDPALWKDKGLDELKGNASGVLDASVPLNLEQPVPTPESLAAKVSLKIEDFQPPTAPQLKDVATIGKGTIQLQAEVAKKQATVAVQYALSAFRMAPYVDGPVDLAFTLGMPDDQKINTTFTVDLTKARLSIGQLETEKLPGEMARLIFSADTTGLRDSTAAPSVDFGLDYALFVKGKTRGRLEFAPAFAGELMGFKRGRVEGVKLGNTEFDAALAFSENPGFTFAVNGKRLDLPEILGVASPIVRQILLDMAGKESVPAGLPQSTGIAKPKEPTAKDPIAMLLLSFQSDVNFDEVRVAKDKTLTKLETHTVLKDGELHSFKLTAIEGGKNLLKIELAPPVGQAQPLTVIIPNVSALAQLVVAPLGEFKLPDSELSRNIDVARKVPNNFRGGILYLDGAVNLKDPEQLFNGKMRMDELFLMEVPCLVRGIAQRTLRPVKEQEVFKIFNIENVHYGKTKATIKKLRMEGPLTMNIFEAEYLAAEPRVKLKGDHALVKFEVDWPMKEPFGMKHVWLENALIRAIGTNDESWSDLIDK
ncbi:MAG: hypothetical protein SFY80_06235 [Verrucomicrobiota bacterium]|nr:hypothetical protein [Verrucomicrobiota bacterium]